MKRELRGTTLGTRRDSADRPSEIEALADMLDANRFCAATVQGFGAGQWHTAALAAQVRDPSVETRAIVLRVLQQREAARARAERGVAGAVMGMSPNNSNRAFDEWLARYRGQHRHALATRQESVGRHV